MNRTAHDFWESVLAEIDDGGFFAPAPGAEAAPRSALIGEPASADDAAGRRAGGFLNAAVVQRLLMMLVLILISLGPFLAWEFVR